MSLADAPASTPWQKVTGDDGYILDDDESIRYHAYVGDWYLRVNDLEDGWTWLVMHEGRVVKEGPGEELLARCADEYEAMKGAEAMLESLRRQLHV